MAASDNGAQGRETYKKQLFLTFIENQNYLVHIHLF